jgi:rubrerythrin
MAEGYYQRMDYWFSAHDIAKLAAEMESNGVVFYDRLQQVADDATVSDMCGFFAQQEREHRATFLAIAETSRKLESEQCYSVDICGMLKASMHELGRILSGAPSRTRKSALVSDSLAIAAQVEATSIKVYTEMLERHTHTFAGVLAKILEEEQKHLRMIQKVRKRLHLPLE